jgi:hypothetical protein
MARCDNSSLMRALVPSRSLLAAACLGPGEFRRPRWTCQIVAPMATHAPNCAPGPASRDLRNATRHHDGPDLW